MSEAAIADVKSEILELEKELAAAAEYAIGEARNGNVEVSEHSRESTTPVLKDLVAMHSRAIEGVAARNGISIPPWRIRFYVMDVYGVSTFGRIQEGSLDSYEEKAVSRANLIHLLGDHVPELTEPHNLNTAYSIPPHKEDFTCWLREHLGR